MQGRRRELLTLAKGQGYEMTREEAEAGGVNNCYMVDGCSFKCGTLKDC